MNSTLKVKSDANDKTPLGHLKESKTYEVVKDYYGKVLETSKDLKTSACTAGSAPNSVIIDIMKKVTFHLY